MTLDPIISQYLTGDDFTVRFDTPRDMVKELKEIDEEHVRMYGTHLFNFKEWENYHKMALTKDKIVTFDKKNGYLTAIFETIWKDYNVYEPIYSWDEEPACIGYPLMILEKGNELRLTTPDEALELLEICNLEKN